MIDELRWVIDRARSTSASERAGRYLRKFYPWYAERLELPEGGRPRAVHGAHHGRRAAAAGRARGRPEAAVA